MTTRIPTGHHGASLSSPSISSRPRRPPSVHRRPFHASTPRRRIPDSCFPSRVANCETPSTLDDSRDDSPSKSSRLTDPTPTPKDVTVDVAPPPSLSERLEGALSRSSACAASLALGFLFLFASFGLIEAITERIMAIIAIGAFLWSWGNRVAYVRRQPSISAILQLGLRLGLMGLILAAGAFQFREFVFLHQRGIFPICALVTLVTVVGHFLLRLEADSVPHELEKPHFESLAPFLTDDVTAVQRMEQRLAMIWLFFSSVCIAPFIQELLYRGVIAQAARIPGMEFIGLAVGAISYNLSQPFRSGRQQLAMFFTSVVWGLVYFMTDCNLMYPCVAHLMHNAFLFAVYHYESITECL